MRAQHRSTSPGSLDAATLPQRLLSFPLVMFGCYSLQVAYEGYFEENEPKNLDVVELWSGVESIVAAARGLTGPGGRRLSAEGFDKYRSVGSSDRPGSGCEDITCIDGFRNALKLLYRTRRGGLLWMAPTCSSFGFANSHRCKRTASGPGGDESYDKVAIGNLEAQAAAFLFVLATALGIHAVIENPISSALFPYIDSYLHSFMATVSINTYRCAFDTDTPMGQRMLKGYKFWSAQGNSWIQQLGRKCACPGGIRGRQHIQLMTEEASGRSGNSFMKKSQAYPKELGRAVVSAWLTTQGADIAQVPQVADIAPQVTDVAQVPQVVVPHDHPSLSMGMNFEDAWGEVQPSTTVEMARPASSSVCSEDFDSAWGDSTHDVPHSHAWEGWE